MSYRALKRLLGETSLERKCHFLFGTFSILLITGSFWLYARQTEHLAYEQINTACRLLVVQIVDEQLATGCRTVKDPKPRDQDRLKLQAEFLKNWEETNPKALRRYDRHLWTPAPYRPDRVPDQASQAKIKEFQDNPDTQEDSQLLLSQSMNYYFGAVRATPSCLACHQQMQPDLKKGDLLALVKIDVPTSSIEVEFHTNRAILISTALVTVLLIMFGNYVIVRYVIVKPAKHLKEVADAISSGELNVRSEIQTGDEFEDLSHAFNRMLRSLVAMQERLRKVNNDLDRKVDELAHANLALYESNRLKSDFMANMSHELKTPLHSILGFSGLLAGSQGLTEKQQKWVGNIRTSGDGLMRIVMGILDLAKLEAGKMQLAVTTFQAEDLCEGLVTMARPLAEKKNIDLRAEYGPALPPMKQDMVRVQQVVSNLLSNAIKFTPEGGRVTLKADVDASQMVLTVQDTGVGIAAEEQELVFEKFRQAGDLMTREQGGTGLGLSIVRELARLLGGSVSLESELGRGSAFTVRLPLVLSEEPKLEFDLAFEGVDLGKAQRIDVRMRHSET